MIIKKNVIYARNEEGNLEPLENLLVGQQDTISADKVTDLAMVAKTGRYEHLIGAPDPDDLIVDAGIEVGNVEPERTSIDVWIDTNENQTTYRIPEVKDNIVNTTDTWSSQKINQSTSYVEGETLTGGTWIDGKPIYRFVWKGTTSLKKAQGVLCRLPEGHFDTVFTLRGIFKRTTDNNWFAIPNGYYGGTGWTVNLRTDIATNEPDGILAGFGEEYTDLDRPIIVIAEYTKS